MDDMDSPRQVTDSAVLAAMAHPLRRRLLDVLRVYGPGKVTALAEHTGERVPNISHHLKVLAAADLIAEAPELAGDRRERWWRLVSPRLRWSPEDFDEDPAGAVIAQAALSLNLDHHVGAVRAWYGADEDRRRRWADTDFSTDKWLHLSPAELAELSRQVIALFDDWATRVIPDDGEQRDPVVVFAYGVPAEP